MKYHTICLLFLITVLSLAAYVHASCDPYQRSFELCYADSLCSERLFININGNDTTTFRELIHQHPANELSLLERIFCENGTIEEQELWIHLMARTEYCPDKNEFFVSGVGCVCRDNKICEYNASKKIFSPIENEWFLAILSAFTLILSGVAVYTFRWVNYLYSGINN